MTEISIAAHHGTHLLVERGGRFAVVERRNGMVYGLDPQGRDGFAETSDGIAAAVGPEGWQDEAAARKTFAELCERGETLARRIW